MRDFHQYMGKCAYGKEQYRYGSRHKLEDDFREAQILSFSAASPIQKLREFP
ncbi:hypothetical protein L21SP2_3236 [Salinispira pacifica]|uniref:Uncharacterized protein n=1 Tax=Salinispira pacifica TaxID=1307761 RepID=V5WNJ0_9SPIO|nr:hypothetical protein L21SP2_3236 [Salinispira pacifica]